MNIYLPNESKQSIGGGWTWLDTFKKYVMKAGHTVSNLEQANVILIPSASMITKEHYEAMKATGKPMVLRVDNVLKNSNNRGAGMSRLLKYAKGADRIIFQSIWARQYVGDWLRANDVNITRGNVIYNGGDTELFFVPRSPRPRDPYRYLFIKNKRFEEAAYYFTQLFTKNHQIKLTIVGRFHQALIDHNFDFFYGENVQYIGEIQDRNTIATVMRNSDVLLFPAFADACPQTVIEARLCGLKIELVNPVGGTREIMQLPLEMLTAEYMVKEYVKVLETL